MSRCWLKSPTTPRAAGSEAPAPPERRQGDSSVARLGRSVVDDGEPATCRELGRDDTPSSSPTVHFCAGPGALADKTGGTSHAIATFRGDHARAQSSADDRGSCGRGRAACRPQHVRLLPLRQRLAVNKLRRQCDRPNQDAGVLRRRRPYGQGGNVQVRGRPSSRRAGTASRSRSALQERRLGDQGFPASLNIDRRRRRRPSIDFAGAGRTVRGSRYEPNAAFGHRRTSSRAASTRAANSGCPRAGTARRKPLRRSTSIPTARRDPSVAGGAAVAGADPVRGWCGRRRRRRGDTTLRQIFVVKGLKQATAARPARSGRCRRARNNENGFCWQQSASTARPELADVARQGGPHAQRRPDPLWGRAGHRLHRQRRHGAWVVWYEEDRRGSAGSAQRHGVRGEDRRDGAPTAASLGSRRKRYCGSDERARHLGHARLRELRREPEAEDGCTLNKVAATTPRSPRRRGRSHPATRPFPWVCGRSHRGGKHAVFVSRLVGGTTSSSSTATADLEYGERRDPSRHHVSGNIPYISWQEEVSGEQ